MAREITLDTRGFNTMIRSLKSYTNQNTRTIVRAVTNEVLLLASSKTKVASKKKIEDNVSTRLRLPLETPSSKDLVALTKSGKVWISLKGEGRLSNSIKYGQKNSKSFLLVKQVKSTKLPNKVAQRIPWKGGRKIPKKTQQALTRALAEAHREQKRELNHRLSVRGLGASSFLYLVKMLGLKKTKHSKINMSTYRAMNKLGKAKQSLKAYEKLTGKDNVAIVLYTAVQSALNPRGGRGITAFKNAMNGKTNEFKRASKKDMIGFAIKFANRNGFQIRA